MSVGRVKSKLALQWSIDQLKKEGKLRLWTFTLPRCQSISKSCADWSEFCRALVRELGFSGVRVFELHENHGLHVHCVVNQYYSVSCVRAIARRYGWGRIDVGRCNRAPYYVAKYVSKGQREGCFYRRRLWAAFGPERKDAVKVKDVETTSGKSRSYRHVEREQWLKNERKKGGRLKGIVWSMYCKATWDSYWYWLETGTLPPLGGGGPGLQLALSLNKQLSSAEKVA